MRSEFDQYLHSLAVQRRKEREALVEQRLRRVLQLRAEGLGRAAIGQRLGLSEQTVHRLLRASRKGEANGNQD